MQTQGLRNVGSVHIGTLLQLFVSHVLVGVFVIVGLQIGPGAGIVIVGGIAGVVLTLNISSSLHLLELVLDRLTNALPVEPPSLRWRWPLTPLFLRVNALGRSSGKQTLLDQQATEYREQLSHQMGKTAAQEERNRLARDLHDSIKQQIFGVVVSAAAVKARWERDPAGARRTIDDIERTALEAQVEMQALLQQLRPLALENVGLVESLRMQCQALGYRTGAEVSAELSDLPPDDVLPLGTQEVIFRIVQEGFANIARHARASHIWLSLHHQQGALLVEVGDDGQGFVLEKQPQGYGGMGLANIRERVRALGGQSSIWSQPGQGTTLHLFFPLLKEPGTVHPQVEDEQAVAASKKTSNALKVGITAVELAAALILLYAPTQIAVPLVGVAFLVALLAWLWSQRARMHVVLSMGRNTAQHFSLLARSYALLAGLALLLLSEIGYFKYILFSGERTLLTLLPPIIGIGICAIACCAAAAGSFYAQERYYRLLPEHDRREILTQKLRSSALDWLVWALVAVLTFAFTSVHIFFPYPRDINGWAEDSGLLFLTIWLFYNFAHFLHIMRWRWLSARKVV